MHEAENKSDCGTFSGLKCPGLVVLLLRNVKGLQLQHVVIKPCIVQQ